MSKNKRTTISPYRYWTLGDEAFRRQQEANFYKFSYSPTEKYKFWLEHRSGLPKNLQKLFLAEFKKNPSLFTKKIKQKKRLAQCSINYSRD